MKTAFDAFYSVTKMTILLLSFLVVLPQHAFASGDKYIQDATVLIATDRSRGSGVVIRHNDDYFLYTCTHVLYGAREFRFTDIHGNRLQAVSLQLADDADVARVRLTNYSGAALRISTGRFVLGDAIRVYGDSQGISSMTIAIGTILSLSPTTFEISADIVSGNSGGPIVNMQNDVIGLSAFILYPRVTKDAEGTRFTRPRRFAELLSREISWTDAPLDTFTMQTSLLNYQSIVDDYSIMFKALDTRKGWTSRRAAAQMLRDRWLNNQHTSRFQYLVGYWAHTLTDYITMQQRGRISHTDHRYRITSRKLDERLERAMNHNINSLKDQRWLTPFLHNQARILYDYHVEVKSIFTELQSASM
jgi:hypothetical protein